MTNNKLIRISYNVIIGMLLLGGVILVIKNFCTSVMWSLHTMPI